jgi:hypothetical protein
MNVPVRVNDPMKQALSDRRTVKAIIDTKLSAEVMYIHERATGCSAPQGVSPGDESSWTSQHAHQSGLV